MVNIILMCAIKSLFATNSMTKNPAAGMAFSKIQMPLNLGHSRRAKFPPEFEPENPKFIGILCFSPPARVRVVRFYVSCFLLVLVLLLLVLLLLVLLLLPSSPPPPAQPRPSTHSGLCRTSTTTIHAQLRSGREHWAGMVVVEVRQGTLGVDGRGEVRQGTLGVDTRGVPCRTSTTTIHAKCSLPDLNREYPRQVFPAGPHEICQIECQKICQMECQLECQKICQIKCHEICQIECQKVCQIKCQIE